jgi:hypothetical protein
MSPGGVLMIEGKTDAERANRVFQIFSEKLCGEVQGACAIIAMHIWGELVATDGPEPIPVGGYLTSMTGWRRAHWWIEKDGLVYDPMGDEYRNEPGFKREIAHKGHWHDFCEEYKRQGFMAGIS